MSEKLTEWFPQNVKPEIVGVYQTDAPTVYQAYQYWNGKRWGCYCHSVERAEIDGASRSAHQDARWRGLAENPKAAK